MLRSILLSATLLLASFGVAAEEYYTTNNNGKAIVLTDKQTSACGQNFRAYVDDALGFEGCWFVSMLSTDANQKLVTITWNVGGGDTIAVTYLIEDFQPR